MRHPRLKSRFGIIQIAQRKIKIKIIGIHGP
jgi:hypothetical protein